MSRSSSPFFPVFLLENLSSVNTRAFAKKVCHRTPSHFFAKICSLNSCNTNSLDAAALDVS